VSNIRSSRIIRPLLALVPLLAFAAAAPRPVTLSLPSRGKVVRLLVTGDAGGSGSRLTKGILAVQKTTPIDAIILAGDNVYPCGLSGVDDPQWSLITRHFHWAKVPIFPVLGNHDYGDANPEGRKASACTNFPSNPGAEVSATGTIENWNFPARSYVLQHPLATLVMLDTQPIAMNWTTSNFGANTSPELQQWLRARLDGAKTKWRIVVGHHTFFSSGEHGRRNGFDQQHMRALLPLLRAEHVDLYMSGHDHDMELIGNPASRTDPLFLVSGAGSGLYTMAPRPATSGEPPTIWPQPLSTTYGFAILEISDAELAVTFYDAAGTKISDRFVKTK
jgi:predicted phosphodiesterase